jgi:TPP-dependent pyruvate/acetoin dehydrogenase alpha subunit
VDADIARIMDDAVAKAKAGPRPVPADVHEHVYARYR